MLTRVDARRPFTIALVALIALSWLALAIWSLSTYAHYLDHDAIKHVPSAFSSHYISLLLVFVAGWVLMTVAMMLPTSLPLVLLFERMVHARADRRRLVVLLIAGYLAVWTVFGGLAHVGDLLIHEVVHHVAWLDANAWVISAAILALAGLYQFSALKYACLEACRSPLSFIAAHWQGRREGRGAFRLGVQHGLFCVGCCWSLMLLMFALASGSIAWMLALGAVMAIEKNVSWGRRLSAPLGVALLGASALVCLFGVIVVE